MYPSWYKDGNIMKITAKLQCILGDLKIEIPEGIIDKSKERGRELKASHDWRGLGDCKNLHISRIFH